MASRKKRLTQGQRVAVPKLRKLKEKGLFKGNVRRPSKYGIKQTKIYANVIADKASVIKVPRRELSKYRDAFNVKNGKVVIPRIEGERVRYNPKTKAIETFRSQHGERIKKTILPSRPEQTADAPLGPNLFYVLPLGNNFHIREKTFAAIKQFIDEYEQRYRRKYRNWQKYVTVEEILSHEDSDEFGERLTRSKRRAKRNK